MIVGVAFCPHPPALVPELGVGVGVELDEMRAACSQALSQLAVAGADQIVLVGGGETSMSHLRLGSASMAFYGASDDSVRTVAADPAKAPPLSLAVGMRLVEATPGLAADVVGFAVASDRDVKKFARYIQAQAEKRAIGLLVLGDGSACRNERAPGYLDVRALDFDTEVLGALRSGLGTELARLDGPLGAELLAAGIIVWHAVGELLSGDAHQAQVFYAGDPFGVGYFVAYWTPIATESLESISRG